MVDDEALLKVEIKTRYKALKAPSAGTTPLIASMHTEVALSSYCIY